MQRTNSNFLKTAASEKAKLKTKTETLHINLGTD